MTRIYLAGPMSQMPLHNFPAFAVAAARLREAGYTVVSPAEMDGSDSHYELAKQPWDYYLRRDLAELVKCEAVAVLPGWKRSKGASLEVHIARELGMPIIDVRTCEPLVEPGESILEEADRLVHGDRGQAYGPPDENFGSHGILWAQLLQRAKWQVGTPIPAEIVGLMMVVAKADREAYCHRRDNLVDIVGYTEAVDMVWRGQAEP